MDQVKELLALIAEIDKEARTNMHQSTAEKIARMIERARYSGLLAVRK